MAHLQADSIQLENAKSTFNSLRQEGVDQSKAIQEKSAQIQGTLKYLLANQESLDDAQTKFVRMFDEKLTAVDPIHKLQRMSMSELTHAYDYLLGILRDREALIKDRIADSLKRYGSDERILFDSKDFRIEQETMPDLLNNLLRYDQNAIDSILGVNEQIQNIEMLKSIPPEEKMY